jgi:hypothetical protein
MKDKQRWMHLCEQAADEQDGAKLMDLVAEITRLLDAKQHRLDAHQTPPPTDCYRDLSSHCTEVVLTNSIFALLDLNVVRSTHHIAPR